MNGDPRIPGAPAQDEFDPAEAMRLIARQERRVRDALDVRLHETLAAWGMAWLVGFGAMWWQVRDQRPYEGPSGVPAVLFTVLLLAAGGLTAWRTRRATAGIGGSSDWRGRLYGLGWAGGFFGLFGLIAATVPIGASPAVRGLLGTCGAMLVVGIMYLFDAAAWGVRPMAVLGGWMLLLAGTVGFAGPVTATLLGATLGGGGFLLVAAWLAARRVRSRPGERR